MPTYNFPQLNQCDHCILSFLHPYLMQEPNRLVISQIHQLLRHFRGALNSGGVISLSQDGSVKFITQQAEQLLKQYFPVTTFEENSLPSHLTNWFKFEVSQLQGDDPCFCHTFQIEQGEQQLKIHLISEQMGKDYHLLLEERKKLIFSV